MRSLRNFLLNRAGMLHQFVVGDTFYGVPNPEWGDALPVIDERSVSLSRVLKTVGDTSVYEYDFGDDWRHDLVLETVIPAHEDRSYDLSLECD